MIHEGFTSVARYWVFNDDADYFYVIGLAKVYLVKHAGNKEAACRDLTDELVGAVEDKINNFEIPGMYRELLANVVSEIDWRDIAACLVEKVSGT